MLQQAGTPFSPNSMFEPSRVDEVSPTGVDSEEEAEVNGQARWG